MSQTGPEEVYEPRYPLIGPDDPPPFTVFNEEGSAKLLLVADHADRAFPRSMGQLGVDDWVLEQHVAYDIGSGDVGRFLALRLNAPAVMSRYSRLIVDPNRQLDDPTAFIQVSDGIAIPGNLGLEEEHKALRVQSFFDPYHCAINARIEAFRSRGITPAFISIHSCTPVFDRVVRPWHIGILWDKDPRIAQPLIERLKAVDGVCIGDNEPYSGRHPHDYTIDHHAEPLGLPHVGIEIRQDLIDTEAGAREWAELLGEALAPIFEDPDLYQPLDYAETGKATTGE